MQFENFTVIQPGSQRLATLGLRTCGSHTKLDRLGWLFRLLVRPRLLIQMPRCDAQSRIDAQRTGSLTWRNAAIIGVVIGINAAFIAICTGWLSDIKLGHCSYAWWLNQKFCCWGIDTEGRINGLVMKLPSTYAR